MQTENGNRGCMWWQHDIGMGLWLWVCLRVFGLGMHASGTQTPQRATERETSHRRNKERAGRGHRGRMKAHIRYTETTHNRRHGGDRGHASAHRAHIGYIQWGHIGPNGLTIKQGYCILKHNAKAEKYAPSSLQPSGRPPRLTLSPSASTPHLSTWAAAAHVALCNGSVQSTSFNPASGTAYNAHFHSCPGPIPFCIPAGVQPHHDPHPHPHLHPRSESQSNWRMPLSADGVGEKCCVVE